MRVEEKIITSSYKFFRISPDLVGNIENDYFKHLEEKIESLKLENPTLNCKIYDCRSNQFEKFIIFELS